VSEYNPAAMARVRLAASILSADFARLGHEVKLVEPHADMIHVDVMDAHFVPPLTIGPVVVEALRSASPLPLHCHLMIERPEALLGDFAEAGADMITFHLEAAPDPGRVIDEARSQGLRAGIAVNPDTPVEEAFGYLDRLDNLIVMSVRPGWAGQDFMEEALPKVESARREIDRLGLSVDVEVDGGINEETGRRCVEAGATVLAAASSIFKAPDPAEAARRLSHIARGGAGG
jgi:ribulose-phosphate 3-epimerase